MNSKEALNQSLQNLEDGLFNSLLIQDNKLVFIYNNNTFRVRMPIQSEQVLMENKRNMVQLEYSKQDGYITRRQLISSLKESGAFDIENAEKQKEQLMAELKRLWIILATKNSENVQGITHCKNEIAKIQDELKNISIDIATQLAPSLESRLEKFTIEYLTFLITDKQVDNEWVRVWETFEDFQKEDSAFIERCCANVTWLILSKRM